MDEDDSEPPPLEDCSLLEVIVDTGHVVDPVFGPLDGDLYALWNEQQKQREFTRKAALMRVIPAVRYTEESDAAKEGL